MSENVRYLMHKYGIVNSDWSQNINILYSKVESYSNRLLNIEHKCTGSGVVGNFLLWERSHGIMVTYPIVIRGGGGWYLNKWSFMKDKNPCSKMGV